MVKLLILLTEGGKKVKKESLIPRVPISVVVECGGARYVTGKDSDGKNNVTGHRITCETNLWAHNRINWGGKIHSKCGSCHLMSWSPKMSKKEGVS